PGGDLGAAARPPGGGARGTRRGARRADHRVGAARRVGRRVPALGRGRPAGRRGADPPAPEHRPLHPRPRGLGGAAARARGGAGAVRLGPLGRPPGGRRRRVGARRLRNQPRSARSASTSSARAAGAVAGAYRRRTVPSGPSRNFAKFHSTSPPGTPSPWAPVSHRNRGWAPSPLTSTFACIGKVTP